MRLKTLFSLIWLNLLVLIPFPSHASEDFVHKAKKSMDLMDYDQSIYYFEQSLLRDPPVMGIRPQLGFCYFRTGKYEDALRVCQDEIARFPGNVQAHILMAYVYYTQGKHKEAVKICQDYHTALEQYCSDEAKKIGKEYKVRRGGEWVLNKENLELIRTKIQEKHSNLGLPYFILSVLNKKKSSFKMAAEDIQQALHWGYDAVECFSQLIDLDLTQDNWENAIKKARDAQRTTGSQAEFFFLMGYAYYQMEDMDSAEANFKIAFNTKPYMIEALQNLAKVHLVKGNFEEAAGEFKQIMKVSPFDYNVQFLLERALNKQSVQTLENRPRLTKNISEKIKPMYTYIFETNIASVVNLINSAAMTLLRKGQLDEAIVMTRSFLDIYTASPELSYNLAHYYNIKNDLGKALEYAWHAVELKDDFKDALDLVGNIFFKMSDYDNSIRAYNKVIAIDPKDAMGHYNLGCVFSAKGDLDSAEESWLNAIRYEQNKRIGNRDEASDDELSFSLIVVGRRVAFMSYMSLGHIYRDRKLWDKALENYQKALELEINNSELHYEIGKIYIMKDRIPEAKKYFDRYLYLGGEQEAEVKQLLETLKPKNQLD